MAQGSGNGACSYVRLFCDSSIKLYSCQQALASLFILEVVKKPAAPHERLIGRCRGKNEDVYIAEWNHQQQRVTPSFAPGARYGPAQDAMIRNVLNACNA
jgi:hypothetical protein